MNEKLKEIIEKSNNIVFFGGAGVSTESGVPDFRSENGLYNAKQNYGYPPEEMLSHDFFWESTKTFYDYYKKNLIATWAKPNDAHKALARLELINKLKAIVTQNIDGLHQLAGSKNVFELHGSIHRNYCTKCRKFFDLGYILDERNCTDGVPHCPCGGIIKPDVVLYGENLDSACIGGTLSAISNADTLIIGGTSLAVYPAASFINYFKGNNLVIINKSQTSSDSIANLVIHEPIGKTLSYLLQGED